ncbi:MAG: hypothetical protein A2W91_15745 [Bacteroidetes bacterium GWF2_38_335]|nr:MAG: hypothetical protein A2W91_15745 [Bacteroidetes bacterium GWF2_38_335]HBS85258.1 hypothetical protein [Bacteroidales bacterium]
MIIYGSRKIRIKKHDDFQIKCENCGGYEHRFYVYQEYFHVFFIPIFPSGIKTIKSACLKCSYLFNQEKKNHYLSITRTPVYFYTGIILLAGLVFAGVIGNLITQREKSEFVNDPMINDVYLIRDDDNDSKTYYFLKIKNINSDTVELIHSAYQYNEFVSNMHDSDYFVKDKVNKVLKSDLKDYLDDGTINSVERDYEKTSRFMIEK